MELLPDAKREHYTREIVLGRMSMFQAGKELGISDTSVARYITQLPEDEKLAILATAMHDAKVKTAMQHAAIVNEFGEDTDKDLKWVLRARSSRTSRRRSITSQDFWPRTLPATSNGSRSSTST